MECSEAKFGEVPNVSPNEKTNHHAKAAVMEKSGSLTYDPSVLHRLLSPEEAGRFDYVVDPSLGHGTMIMQRLTPSCLVVLVDIACTWYPNWPSNPLDTGEGQWFSVNYCFEGRCEVNAGSQGYAVVKAGDCCVSCADRWPEGFSYPLGLYRGVELWLNTEMEHDPSFSLLGDVSISLEKIARDAGLAAVFSNDPTLNGPLQRMKELLEDPNLPHDKSIAGCKIELLRFLLALSEHDVAAARPTSLLAPTQMAAVKRMSERMQATLATPHDARVMASELGVSAATLNNWFTSLYGMTAAAYLRHLRMERAAVLLAEGCSVTEAALAVGYANPSKFAAAFKREHHLTPSEFRRMEH